MDSALKTSLVVLLLSSYRNLLALLEIQYRMPLSLITYLRKSYFANNVLVGDTAAFISDKE